MPSQDPKTRLATGRRLVVQFPDASRDKACNDDPPVEDEMTITTNSEETVQELADRFGVTADSIYEHNPHVNGQRIVPPKTSIKLVVPAKGRPGSHLLTRAVDVIEASSGDTLAAIAFRYGVPMDQIRHNNPSLSEVRPLATGARVILAAPHVDIFTGSSSLVIGQHDTLAVIADWYGTTREALKDANPDATFAAGETIRIPTSASNSHFHSVNVEEGESLASFAARHPFCPLERIIAINPSLDASDLHAPLSIKALTMPTPSDAVIQQLPENQLLPINYIVNAKPGRTLQEVSEIYNVPIKDLLKLNPTYLAYGVIPKGGMVVLPPNTETRENPKDLLRHLHLTKPNVYEAIAYTTRDGEPIGTICRKFGCDEAKLRAINKKYIKDYDRIIRGTKQLFIPVSDQNSKVFDGESKEEYSQRVLSDPTYYRRMHKALGGGKGGAARSDGLVDDDDFMSASGSSFMMTAAGADGEDSNGEKRKQREAYMAMRARERTYREELERGKALEDMGIVTRLGDDDGDFAELIISQQNPSMFATGAEGVSRNAFDRVQLEPFLNFKNDKHRKLLMELKSVEDERDALAAENVALRQDLEEAGHLQSTRNKLVKALFELYKTAKKSAQLTDQLGIRVQMSPQTRESLLQGLHEIESTIQTILHGHRTVIVNYMTDAEVYHLGVSPNLILDELNTPFVSRLLITSGPQAVAPSAPAVTSRLYNSHTAASRAKSPSSSIRAGQGGVRRI